ncbi:hypothetical protein SAMN04487943_105194 [Gracilibacillus orientalis]|uniref:Uncharacterized protein n=1 Tax=Gracilibacillus orientalis TaxID=334253 RepID=A0A1I4LTU5_9BACI|nr:hypothetical protein [Gracilibacillus orientalis]SFL94253.1 hypothetical protein SAMN04487943_105194 [Gracilibacillus orientalis]
MQMLAKLLLTSCFLIIGFFLYTSDVKASEQNTPQIKEDIISVQSTKYIKEGNASIRRVDSQTVGSNCNTSSYSSVQQINCTIYLQVKNKSTGEWVNTGNSKRFVKYSSSYVSGRVNFRIEKGFEYRIRTLHAISHYGNYEQFYSVTGRIKY